MTKKSPATLLHHSMTESAKLAARARRLLETQLKSIEKELKSPALPPLRRAELIDDTTRILDTLNRSVENSGRLLTAKGAPQITNDSPSHEEIIHELTKGQAKHPGR